MHFFFFFFFFFFCCFFFFFFLSLSLLPFFYFFSPFPGGGVFVFFWSEKNRKGKPGFTLFFLLPYGVTAEYQPFKFFNRN